MTKGINGVLGRVEWQGGRVDRRFVLFGWESTNSERDQQAQASAELNPCSESKQIYQTPMGNVEKYFFVKKTQSITEKKINSLTTVL